MQNLTDYKEKIEAPIVAGPGEALVFKIQHTNLTGDITELVCKNGNKLCDQSVYFKSLIRNVSALSLQGDQINITIYIQLLNRVVLASGKMG